MGMASPLMEHLFELYRLSAALANVNEKFINHFVSSNQEQVELDHLFKMVKFAFLDRAVN